MAKHKEEPQLPPPQKPAKASQEGGEEVVAGHKFECTRSFLAQQGGGEDEREQCTAGGPALRLIVVGGCKQ